MAGSRPSSVTVTCRVLGLFTQAFYKWRKTPLTQRDCEDAHLINAALDIHADDPRLWSTHAVPSRR